MSVALSPGLFSLPGGHLDGDGRCHREGVVRPLTGRDEEWLFSLPEGTPEPVVVTDLLARCVTRLGPGRPGREGIRALTPGDRDYLLLALRRVTFGDKVALVLVCPDPACGAKMDVEIRVSEIPVEARSITPSFRVALADGREIELRLPRGRDLEELALTGEEPSEGMASWLLNRCVLSAPPGALGRSVGASPSSLDRSVTASPSSLDRSVTASPSSSGLAELSTAARAALIEEIERRSPQVEADMETACPACGKTFDSALEPAALLLGEVLSGRARFEREVHTLALHYHWPLREILGLTRPRRHRHLQVLAEALEARAT